MKIHFTFWANTDGRIRRDVFPLLFSVSQVNVWPSPVFYKLYKLFHLLCCFLDNTLYEHTHTCKDTGSITLLDICNRLFLSSQTPWTQLGRDLNVWCVIKKQQASHWTISHPPHMNFVDAAQCFWSFVPSDHSPFVIQPSAILFEASNNALKSSLGD